MRKEIKKNNKKKERKVVKVRIKKGLMWCTLEIVSSRVS